MESLVEGLLFYVFSDAVVGNAYCFRFMKTVEGKQHLFFRSLALIQDNIFHPHLLRLLYITKTRLFKYIENVTPPPPHPKKKKN